ncbi:prostatic spermine-binding protein-like [Actinia tenebrosa]|uniref:Prostatic spermine-binding protein-like n=1 Tax=Actinia tenebrosa TaxID=6105 RepID=A0A6P8I1L0_ACTTE|nr:prostatic spermine-binding protein-like [Actinia tenebrosa]
MYDDDDGDNEDEFGNSFSVNNKFINDEDEEESRRGDGYDDDICDGLVSLYGAENVDVNDVDDNGGGCGDIDDVEDIAAIKNDEDGAVGVGVCDNEKDFGTNDGNEPKSNDDDDDNNGNDDVCGVLDAADDSAGDDGDARFCLVEEDLEVASATGTFVTLNY